MSFSSIPLKAGPGLRARRFRARKRIPKIYTGAYSLFNICEGNPRWLIGLLRPLILDYSYSTHPIETARIGRSTQAQRIERTITTFLTLLSTLRMKDPVDKNVSVVELLEEIGEFCFEQVLGREFNPEPILSFTVDEKISEATRDAIGRAINQGALATFRPKIARSGGLLPMAVPGPGEIMGRRVRLAFLLAPRYRLPLVLGRPVDLSPVIDGKRHRAPQDQLMLAELFAGLP